MPRPANAARPSRSEVEYGPTGDAVRGARQADQGLPRTAPAGEERGPVRARLIRAVPPGLPPRRAAVLHRPLWPQADRPGRRTDASPPPSPLRFTADKFITADDILVSVIRVHNPTDRVQTIHVDPVIRPTTTFRLRVGRQRLGARRRSRTARSRAASRGRSPSRGGRTCTASRSTSGSATRCWTIPRAR